MSRQEKVFICYDTTFRSRYTLSIILSLRMQVCYFKLNVFSMDKCVNIIGSCGEKAQLFRISHEHYHHKYEFYALSFIL